MDRERVRLGMALFALVPIGLLALFTFESGWWVLAFGAVVALFAVLGMALWVGSGFTRISPRDLRVFLRADSWGLSAKSRSQPMALSEALAVVGLLLVTLTLFLIWLLADH